MFDAMVASQGHAEIASGSKYAVGGRKAVADILASLAYAVVSLLLCVYTVWGLLIIEASSGTLDHDAVSAVSLLVLLFFTGDGVAKFYALPTYRAEPQRWGVDVVTMLALIPDIRWLWPARAAIRGLGLVRAFRLVQATARLGRALGVDITALERRLPTMPSIPGLRASQPTTTTDSDLTNTMETAGSAAEPEQDPEKQQDAQKEAPQSRRSSSSKRTSFQSSFRDFQQREGHGLVERFSRLASLRVWSVAMLTFVLLDNLSFAKIGSRRDWRVGLGVVGDMTAAASPATALQVADAFAARADSLVFLELYINDNITTVIDDRDMAEVDSNVLTVSRQGKFTAKFDLTDQHKAAALFDLIAVLLLTVMVLWTVRGVRLDAEQQIVEPLSGVVGKIEEMASHLFKLNLNSVAVQDTELFKTLLSKLATLFKTDHFRVTTLYARTEDRATTWTITVSKHMDKPVDGVGVKTNRIDFPALESLSSAGKRKAQIRNFMWRTFVQDPLAMKYLEHFLKHSSPVNHKSLRFYTQVLLYKRLMRSAVKHAEYLVHHYLDPANDVPVVLPDGAWEDIQNRVLYNEPTEASFDAIADTVESRLRQTAFVDFTEGGLAFEKLKMAKKAPLRPVFIQHDFPAGEHPNECLYDINRRAALVKERTGRGSTKDIPLANNWWEQRGASLSVSSGERAMGSFAYRRHVLKLMGDDELLASVSTAPEGSNDLSRTAELSRESSPRGGSLRMSNDLSCNIPLIYDRLSTTTSRNSLQGPSNYASIQPSPADSHLHSPAELTPESPPMSSTPSSFDLHNDEGSGPELAVDHGGSGENPTLDQQKTSFGVPSPGSALEPFPVEYDSLAEASDTQPSVGCIDPPPNSMAPSPTASVASFEVKVGDQSPVEVKPEAVTTPREAAL